MYSYMPLGVKLLKVCSPDRDRVCYKILGRQTVCDMHVIAYHTNKIYILGTMVQLPPWLRPSCYGSCI